MSFSCFIDPSTQIETDMDCLAFETAKHDATQVLATAKVILVCGNAVCPSFCFGVVGGLQMCITSKKEGCL